MKKSREHAERADGIVKAMLAHARGSSGDLTTFNLHDLLNQSVDLAYFGFQGQAHHFSAKIVKDFDPHIQEVQGFEQELTRVFLNILNNSLFSMNEKLAEKGTDYHPELTIKTRDKGDTVEITFQDNGKGMTPAVLSKIFHPFFTTKGANKGTGLGLSLSYDIITRQHHGDLTAESQQGEWSRLIIELPKKCEDHPSRSN
jgi:signal transduction histidine kinase